MNLPTFKPYIKTAILLGAGVFLCAIIPAIVSAQVYSSYGSYGRARSYPVHNQPQPVRYQPQPQPYPVPVYYPQPQPVYYPQPIYYQTPAYSPYYYQPAPLTVSCSASVSNGFIGAPIIWTAYVSGGGGNDSFSWSGTDNPMSYNSSGLSVAYQSPGAKTISVTVWSGDGQTATAYCGTVYVEQPYYNAYPTQYPSYQPTPTYPPYQTYQTPQYPTTYQY